MFINVVFFFVKLSLMKHEKPPEADQPRISLDLPAEEVPSCAHLLGSNTNGYTSANLQ